jgi:hypothetical protein
MTVDEGTSGSWSHVEKTTTNAAPATMRATVNVQRPLAGFGALR